MLGWARRTLDVLTRLATQQSTGVRMITGTDISARHHEPPGWFGLLSDARHCRPGELPAGYPHGIRYTAPLADMPAHLSYLVRRLRTAGGSIEISPVATLQEAATLAPVVVNCTGLGARALASDDTLSPVRGQHLVATNPGISQFTEVDTGDSPDLIAIYPHESHLVLGGTAEPGRWDREPSRQTAAAILARCTALEPRLRTAEITGHRVGLRPTRSKIRLEEQPGTGRARLIHNYGHGGAGVSLAWGCALEVATLIGADPAIAAVSPPCGR